MLSTNAALGTTRQHLSFCLLLSVCTHALIREHLLILTENILKHLVCLLTRFAGLLHMLILTRSCPEIALPPGHPEQISLQH